ncbi:hypothetical protein [Streptomyces neyagawaensis]|uniref:Uncharacterized protein n=1 Tax=Streptomyces neyagawaensis TaxID=42238 RepID=A0ABV3B1R7_9ACTN
MNEAHEGAAFATDEREELCDYIDPSLTERGVESSPSRARARRRPGCPSN